MRIKNFIFFLLAVVCCGCTFFKHSQNPKNNLIKNVSFVTSGKVLDSKRLNSGGKLIIVSFKAGPDVEANEELDKASLMITRGILDVVDSSGGNLKVVFEDQVDEADFVLEGAITQMSSPGRLSRWVMQKRKINLGVKGKLLDKKNNQIIAVFTDYQSLRVQQDGFRQLGLTIGQDIAKFLINE